MSLQQTIQADLKTAMKAKDKERTAAVRVLLGEFARAPEKELDDTKVIALIKKLIKSERELLVAKKESGSAFIDILEAYLPQQATEEDIRKWIDENIDFSEFTNTFQAMRPIMAHFGGLADGAMVKKVLQSLSSNYS